MQVSVSVMQVQFIASFEPGSSLAWRWQSFFIFLNLGFKEVAMFGVWNVADLFQAPLPTLGPFPAGESALLAVG